MFFKSLTLPPSSFHSPNNTKQQPGRDSNQDPPENLAWSPLTASPEIKATSSKMCISYIFYISLKTIEQSQRGLKKAASERNAHDAMITKGKA